MSVDSSGQTPATTGTPSTAAASGPTLPAQPRPEPSAVSSVGPPSPARSPVAAASPLWDAQARRQLRSLQLRAFALTWLSYASYYFARKNLAVSKTQLQDNLGFSTTALGTIDTVYLVAYAIGQFGNGVLGDRIGPRRLITLGMLASAGAALCFGLSASFWPMFIAWAVNGLVQASGWPGNVKAMQPFFGPDLRGKVMGLWTTNYQAGGLLATVLATWLLSRYGWRLAFIGPALWVALVAVLIFFALVQTPAERGLPSPNPDRPAGANAVAAPTSTEPSMATLLRNPVLLMLGSSYFCLKLIRYSLLNWLPFYLQRQLHYSVSRAGYLSLPFELGGIPGSIAIGWISDRYFRKRRLTLAAPALVGLGGALLAYQALGGLGAGWNIALLLAVGFLLFGPDSLLSGTMAQEIGGERATARVAGIINGMGSVGGAVSPMLVAWGSQRFGWPLLFHGMVGIAIAAGLLLYLAQLLLLRQARAR